MESDLAGSTNYHSLSEVALSYARREWPVFPVEPRGKRPFGRLVPHGLKDATADVDRVSAWWTEEPAANVGLVTGIAFDVLDVDKADGWSSLARLVDANGCLPSGPVVLTPGNGAHYYYSPTGTGNRASFVPHLDWRGAGGYVVGAGSVHPNGGLYEWAMSPDEAALAPVPAWLLGLLSKPSRPSPVLTIAQKLERPDDAYGRAALEQEIGRLVMAPEGQRNDQLNRSAHALGQLVGARVLDIGTVVTALEDAALRAGLEFQEIRSTIHSGLKAGLNNPRGAA
jgi:hypothetical protein